MQNVYLKGSRLGTPWAGHEANCRAQGDKNKHNYGPFNANMRAYG